MSYKKTLIVLVFSILFASCNGSSGIDPINNSNYPLSQNLEWEYNTTFEVGHYDTLGNIKSTEVLSDINTIVRIEAINDTLNNYSDLIRFISFDLQGTNHSATTWYENKNDGLYAIAYKSAGASQTVLPKIINGKKYLTIDDLKQFNLFLSFNLMSNKTSGDSLLFWSPKRKVLGYPLIVGNSWRELQNPFKRDRIVEAEENITVDGVDYNVYKIAAIWPSFGIVFNDYISKKYGLVLRELLADSILITTAGSPDGIGFARTKTNTKLIRRNF